MRNVGCFVILALVTSALLLTVPYLWAVGAAVWLAAFVKEVIRLNRNWVYDAANPAPPPEPEGVEETKPLVIKTADGAGYSVYPTGRRSEKA